MFLTLLPSTTDTTTRNAKITLASISFPLLQTGNSESRQLLSAVVVFQKMFLVLVLVLVLVR